MKEHLLYALKPRKPTICHCGKNHYFLSQNHKIIVGTKHELEKLSLELGTPELCDLSKTDLSAVVDVKEMFE